MDEKARSSIPTGCLIALLVIIAFGGILAVVAVLCGLGGHWTANASRESLAHMEADEAAANATRAARPKPTAEVQLVRQGTIQRFIDAGVIDRIEQPGKSPCIYIRSPFFAMDFDKKEQLCKVVCAYHYEIAPETIGDNNDSCYLYNAQDNNRIGLYSYATDLSLD